MTPNVPVGLLPEIRYEMKSPCGDCPFLNTTPFHQGVAESMPSYLESIEAGTFAHTCHKTDNRPECDGPRNHKGELQHCAGAILMLLKTGCQKQKRRRRQWKWLQRGLTYALQTKQIDDQQFSELIETAKRRKDVFTIDGLISFYLRGIEKLVNREGEGS